MDVVRAIAAVPADRDDKPRVVVKIVDSGEIDRKNRNQVLPFDSRHVQILLKLALGNTSFEQPTYSAQRNHKCIFCSG
eukprot:2849801-Amphidinium_carterae.1